MSSTGHKHIYKATQACGKPYYAQVRRNGITHYISAYEVIDDAVLKEVKDFVEFIDAFQDCLRR